MVTSVSAPGSAGDLRWGIVGTGTIAAQFTQDLHISSGSTVYAVASRDPERAQEFAGRHAVPRAGSYAEMLTQTEVDVVYIATPARTHYELALAALEAGKHVVVEKPLTQNVVEARNLIEAARHADRFVTEAMWMNFNPIMEQLHMIIAEGRIGEITSVQASFGLPFPRHEGSRWSPEHGGSALFDQGIYPVTLARKLMGPRLDLFVSGEATADGIDLSHQITFTYPHGRFAQLAGSMTTYVDPSASISGTEGWIRLHAPFWAARRMTIHSGDIISAFSEPDDVEVSIEGHGFVPLIRSINDTIRAGRRQLAGHTHADTLDTLALLAEIRGRVLSSATPAR